ncbi:esterase-like activity of phytase family protein [Actinomycetospora sp. NBC_00405]|uniref:esterase-like activity of phytase family protein n=1 Tax=Actinomycetospora sp. NBC_00405 TaxID=2975952 RepID=UPI002E22B89B
MLKAVAALLVAGHRDGVRRGTGDLGPAGPVLARRRDHRLLRRLDGATYGARRTSPLTGLSGLAVDRDGSLLALSDRSVLFTLDPRSREPRAATPLADGAGEALDAEALAVDADGTRLVTSEATPAGLRFDTAAGRSAASTRMPARTSQPRRSRRRPIRCSTTSRG